MVSFCSPRKALSNGYLVFYIKIFCHEALANQSEKVRISQIQQQPLKVVGVRWTSAIVAALQGRRVRARMVSFCD